MSAASRPVVGVLLASGRARRMGVDKRFLPWPPASSKGGGSDTTATSTVIAAAFDAVAGACDDMVVVAEASTALQRALGDRRHRLVAGARDGTMGDSISAALDVILEAAPPWALVLHLGDHPAVALETTRRLLVAFAEKPNVAYSPCRRGSAGSGDRGGHPVVLPGTLLPSIQTHLAGGAGEANGLRGYWRLHPERRCRVPVDDLGIELDLDTPQDYSGTIYPKV